MRELIFEVTRQGDEWNYDHSLDWHLLDEPLHRKLRLFVQDLNRVYASEPALHEVDFDPSGFQWIDCHDWEDSVLTLARAGGAPEEIVLVALNFTPVPRSGYRVGAPAGGFWREIANSDAVEYGGSGVGNFGSVEAEEIAAHGRPYSLKLTLPPLAAVFFKLSPHPELSTLNSQPSTIP